MQLEATLSRSKTTLTITIGEHVRHYAVINLEPDKRVARKAVRLRRDDHSFEDCSVNEWGKHCTCGSFVFRNKEESPCKHLIALGKVGLL